MIPRREFIFSILGVASLAGCVPKSRKPGVIRIVMLDTGVVPSSPLAHYKIEHSGPPAQGSHGTRVVSILLGISLPMEFRVPSTDVHLTSINVFDDEYPAVGKLAEGILRAADVEADLVNISVGLRHPDTVLEQAVIEAKRKGVLVVAAAGNVPFLGLDFPARYDGVVAVGASDRQGNLHSESAPGVDVVAWGVDVPTLDSSGILSRASGTSLAAAMYSDSIIRQLCFGVNQRAIDLVPSSFPK